MRSKEIGVCISYPFIHTFMIFIYSPCLHHLRVQMLRHGACAHQELGSLHDDELHVFVRAQRAAFHALRLPHAHRGPKRVPGRKLHKLRLLRVRDPAHTHGSSVRPGRHNPAIEGFGSKTRCLLAGTLGWGCLGGCDDLFKPRPWKNVNHHITVARKCVLMEEAGNNAVLLRRVVDEHAWVCTLWAQSKMTSALT